MSDATQALQELCELAREHGAYLAQMKDLLGKIASTLGKDHDSTVGQVGGSVYELTRAIKIVDKNYVLQDPTNVGDNVYDKNGTLRVRQQKWATGSGKTVMKSNLGSAVRQLAGIVPNNPERAPQGSVAIVDIVLTDPPQEVKTTLQDSFGSYAKDMIGNAIGAQGSTLGSTQSVSLRVIVIGDGGTSTKYCADFSNNSVTVRAPVTKQRDEVIVAAALIELLADDVEARGRETVKKDIEAIKQRLT